MSTDATTSSTDRIEKSIVLNAPRARVWRALTDVTQFNAWFGVNLTSPFREGAEVSGRITHPKYAHVTARLWIERLEPEHHFAFRWHPDAIDETVDYSGEPTTLVSFTLEDAPGGTRLDIVESGFDAIPEARRSRAFSGNAKGWASQLENIRKYVEASGA